jgi:hypothetical protein
MSASPTACMTRTGISCRAVELDAVMAGGSYGHTQQLEGEVGFAPSPYHVGDLEVNTGMHRRVDSDRTQVVWHPHIGAQRLHSTRFGEAATERPMRTRSAWS